MSLGSRSAMMQEAISGARYSRQSPSRCESDRGVTTMDDLMPGLRAVLTTTPARWTALIAAVPDDLLRRVPATGEWASIDCLRHLRDAEWDVFQLRLEAFRAGQD